MGVNASYFFKLKRLFFQNWKIIKNDPSKRTIKNPGNSEKIKEICVKINGPIELVDYYIRRKLKRFNQIDRKILKNENFLIAHTEEDFNIKCQVQPNNKRIHFLKDEKETQFLIWQKSNGSISDLNEFLIKRENFCLSVDENQFLNENEIILLISADPGMGKSTILDNLILNSDSETFFIKIVLNAFTKTLKEIKESKIKLHIQDILDIIIKANLPNSHELEITFLKKLAKERKLILMFDGVDEVSDYKEQVKSLIKRLNETYYLKKIVNQL